MSRPVVFITGSTGFIGTHVVIATLKAGYGVRLSIRKAEQEAGLRERHAEFNDRIETVVVSDMSKRESFKAVLQGVDFIFHLASPMPGSGSDVKKDYIEPAVNATESILYAALDFPQIQKVVIVSSILALTPVTALGSKVVKVKDNTGEVIPVDLNAPFPDGVRGHGMKYAASKIFAHQATREFMKSHRPHYALITLHPVFVLGENLLQTTPEEIHGMNALLWASINSEQPQIANAWVHVRDVADAHVKALETKIASGTEFLLCRPPVSWEGVARFVKTEYPAVGCKLEGPFEGGWEIDTSSADRILGLKWRSEEEILRDVIRQQGF
ncbi:NAD(P)-binding protein [Aspergillus heteromorphus CBS 117.55]|uniref:NAD(P)-binding protein n=1 Tax=Aspergillus heteromorphus CBS 117.55 TaxID=1448321 RepID=A0A317W6A9_9EURO|nr:NAD(P)-binding protein [Aspergillus heteromorphus CBS 117.55]PWY82144.1 NAD(P)-binding protein [Aspergillus heteromorphus CBS 117.55]